MPEDKSRSTIMKMDSNRGFAGRFAAFLRGLSLWSWIGIIVFILVAIVGFHFVTRPAALPAAAAAQVSHVHIESVAGLSSATGPLPVTGKVSSRSQASILSESSGEIVRLNHALGDHVSAGEMIASFENSSQQAAVTQAQGSYDAASAALAKVSGSTAANSNIALTQANQSLENSASSVASTLQSTYASLDDAVHTKADTVFSNPDGILPALNLTLTDPQLGVDLVNERSSLKATLADAKSIAANAKSSNVDAQINSMATDAQSVLGFISNLVKAANNAQSSQTISATQLSAFQATAGAARSEVVTALSGLTSAKGAYDTAASGAATAGNTATGGSSNDIAAGQAQLKTAQGSLDAAKANLEKTVIRSPISGTIVSLALTQGGFVSQFSQVAQVSNPGALEIQTNVTPSDAKTIVVGGGANISGNISGVITSIAPALDPTTNKIQVKIGITGSTRSLTDGDTVTVSLNRATVKSANTAPANQPIIIPIISAKITPQGPVVFTLGTSSTQSTLVAHPIKLGTILGNQVQVLDGISPEMDIVTDARGLSDGQTVVVDTDVEPTPAP